MIDNFKAYLERLKKKYEACNDEKERERLKPKIRDCETLIEDLGGRREA